MVDRELVVGLLLFLSLGNGGNVDGGNGTGGDTDIEVETPDAPDVEARDTGSDGGDTNGGTEASTDSEPTG
jgi:hypothetical protein